MMRSKVLERLFHLSPLFGSMVILSMNVSSSPSSHPFLEKALETPLSDTFVFHPSDHDDRSARLLTIARLPNLTHLESSQVIAPPQKKRNVFLQRIPTGFLSLVPPFSPENSVVGGYLLRRSIQLNEPKPISIIGLRSKRNPAHQT